MQYKDLKVNIQYFCMYYMVCVQFEIYSENEKGSLILKVEKAHVNF